MIFIVLFFIGFGLFWSFKGDMMFIIVKDVLVGCFFVIMSFWKVKGCINCNNFNILFICIMWILIDSN